MCRLLWIDGLSILLMTLVVGCTNSMEESGTLTSYPDPHTFTALPTMIPAYPDLNQSMLFPEAALEYFTYDPDAYPQFAEAFPDAPCATWENGGLTWFKHEGDEEWAVRVRFSDYRLCGFPSSQPDKPTEPTMEWPPDEEVSERATEITLPPPPHLDRPLLFYEDSIFPYPFAPNAIPPTPQQHRLHPARPGRMAAWNGGSSPSADRRARAGWHSSSNPNSVSVVFRNPYRRSHPNPRRSLWYRCSRPFRRRRLHHKGRIALQNRSTVLRVDGVF